MKKLSVFPLILSTILLFSCKGTNQDTAQVVTDTVPPIPNITEKGIEPFVIGASLLDIPVKGAFYDTIIIKKYYDWYDNPGEGSGEGYSESDFWKPLEELIANNEIIIERCYGVAMIIKDKDTLIKAEINGEDAKICRIEILSSLFQLENGIRVGMSAPELINNYNALFITQIENAEEYHYMSEILRISIPSLSKNFTIESKCTKNEYVFIEKKYKEEYQLGHYYSPDTLPQEILNDNIVTKITIP